MKYRFIASILSAIVMTAALMPVPAYGAMHCVPGQMIVGDLAGNWVDFDLATGREGAARLILNNDLTGTWINNDGSVSPVVGEIWGGSYNLIVQNASGGWDYQLFVQLSGTGKLLDGRLRYRTQGAKDITLANREGAQNLRCS